MTGRPTTGERLTSIPVGVACATALAWIFVAMIHPTSFAGDDTGRWLFVHVVQLAFTPILAFGVLSMLRGVDGSAAMVARILVVFWAASFAAYDAVAGIATGILAEAGAVDSALYLFEDARVTTMGWLVPSVWLLTAVAAVLAFSVSGARTISLVAMGAAVLVFTPGSSPLPDSPPSPWRSGPAGGAGQPFTGCRRPPSGKPRGQVSMRTARTGAPSEPGIRIGRATR